MQRGECEGVYIENRKQVRHADACGNLCELENQIAYQLLTIGREEQQNANTPKNYRNGLHCDSADLSYTFGGNVGELYSPP